MAFIGLLNFNHREGVVGNDITLYYHGFMEFVDSCKSISPSQEDCRFTMQMCQAMSEYYDNEEFRTQKFRELFSEYIKLPLQRVAFSTIKGICEIGVDKAGLGGFKNEVGQGACDSYSEVSSYYIASSVERHLDCWSGPCFLMEVVGPHLIISGGVIGEGIYIDRLVSPLWLVPQTNNVQAMEDTARTLRALKDSLLSLKRKYEECPGHCLRQPRFPIHQSFDSHQIIYREEIKQHLFRGTVSDKPVVIKFTESYCSEAHQLLQARKFAPELVHMSRVSSRYLMIVMEELQNAVNLYNFLMTEQDLAEDVLSQCSEALGILHNHNICHGDFRHTNILVRSDRISVIDFDWSGKVGTVKYPYFMNHVDIEWPAGATDGELITKEHDKHWLEQFKKFLV